MKEKRRLPEETGYRIFFALAVIFAGVTMLFSPVVAVVELAVLMAIFGLWLATREKRKREMMAYMETMSEDIDAATRGTIVNAPLPVALFKPETDEIIWTNDRFLEVAGSYDHMFDTTMAAAAPSFQSRWLTEGKLQSPEPVAVGDKSFMVFGNLIDAKSGGSLAMTYWVDVTYQVWATQQYEKSRPVVLTILLDNYEDLMRGLQDSERAVLLSDLNKCISVWAEPVQGLLCRYTRDRYLMVFEQEHLPGLQRERFKILEQARELRSPTGIAATLSIGVGWQADTIQELFQNATLSMEMALARGGDQVVLKDKEAFSFIGGKAKESERRTKVKSRVVANALAELLSGGRRVFIMGHKNPDMDVIGAAAGMTAIARKKGVPAYIIKEPQPNPASDVVALLEQLPEYETVFISAEQALDLLDEHSVVVVVDTNRPEQVQSMALLERCERLVVIDHHRRAATYIDTDRMDLNFQDIYASSASELVVELIQYILEQGDLLRLEAEAILAGIMLDTKNFTLRCGSGTFEAAAYLRRAGADTAQVRKLFQSDLEQTVRRYHLVQHAQIYRGSIALAISDQQVDRVIAAKAADELLNISDVSAAIVLAPSGEKLALSARSAGDVNVQLIVEKLGGGGNAAAAGAQITGMSIEEARMAVEAAIDEYFD